jgi:hypothetical protein
MASIRESAKNSIGDKRKMIRKLWYLLISGITLSLFFSVLTFGQEVTGSLVGTVKDTTGAVVAGATVTITDPTKNNAVVRTVQTNDSGEYSAPNLNSGTYTVTVEAANFKKSLTTDVKVDVGQRRTLDVDLAAGNIAETVTVAADPVAVELTTPTAGTTINGDQVRELSINNRNWVQLVALAPGVTNDLADQVYVGTTNPDGQANTINISVNGARSSQNTFTVDGADVTDRGSNITIQAYPSVDSIGEFKVLRSLYPAESGRSGGGQVNIVTRSGEKRFHGSAYEFVRNEIFNANNFLTNASARPSFGRGENGKAKRAPFHYNDFGWTFSGPVYFFNFGENNGGFFRKWDQTFFFFSEEWRKDRRFSAAGTVSVPDQALRNGVFPIDVCINRNNQPTETCAVGNPGRLAAGTPIPAGFYSPAALAYLENVYNQLPLPNNPASGPFALTTSLSNVSDFRQEVLKIDHNFSDKASAYYRYERDEIPTIDGNALFSSGTGLPNVATTSSNSPGRAHTFQTTYAVSPNKILEFRYNYGYGAILSHNIGLLSLANFAAPITLPFANQRDRNPTLGTTLTSANGFTSLTSFGPYDNFSYKSNWTGSFTWIMGSHTMKYGGVYSNYRKNENALAGNNEGQFTSFSATLASGVANTATNTNIQRWASFLVGNATAFNQGGFDYTADLRQRTMEAFAQDEWKFKPNITLYYGVRYSFFGAPFDKNGRLSNFDPAFWNPANAPQVTGVGNRIAGTGNWCNGITVNSQNFLTGPAAFNCTPTISPYGKYVTHSPKKDFAPRVGLAWDPFGKGRTSVRTGYGIYHEQVLNGVFLQNIGTNPPYQQNANVTGNLRFDNPTAGVFVAATVQSLRAVQADWKTPYMQHWSLDLQHQLWKNTLLTIGYFGSKGTNMIGVTEFNDIKPGVALESQCAVGSAYYAQNPTLVQCQPTGYVFRNTSAAPENPNTGNTDILILDQIRPFRGYRSISIIQPRYNSTYHSLQFSAQQRLTGASQINVAYTWSKNLTDAQTDRSSAPQDSYNQKAEYARAALDRRHVFTLNYVYELPFYSERHDLVGNILGGWQASGIVTYQTGLGFTATTSNFDPAGTGLINANPTARPDQLCNPNQDAPHSQAQYFNTSCFRRNPSNTENTRLTGWTNTIGNAGRSTIEGPATFRVDFTLSKNIRFGEHMRLQLRGEAYNILNRTNFRSFSSTNVTSSLFGIVGAVRDPRTMQFGIKFSF